MSGPRLASTISDFSTKPGRLLKRRNLWFPYMTPPPNPSLEPSTLRCGHQQRDGPCGRPPFADGNHLRTGSVTLHPYLAVGHHGQRSARVDIVIPAWLFD